MPTTDPTPAPSPAEAADAAGYIASMAADLQRQARAAGHTDLEFVLAQIVEQARATARLSRQAGRRDPRD